MVTAYLLAETIITVVAGKLGDLFGRKTVFQLSVVVFVGGSILSGLAQNLDWLVAARAIQGLGGGGLTVTATALIGDVIPLRERGRYQGALGAVFGVTTVLGPLLGGFFTDKLSWRWDFYVNVPVGVVVVVLAARPPDDPHGGTAGDRLRRDRLRRHRRLRVDPGDQLGRFEEVVVRRRASAANQVSVADIAAGHRLPTSVIDPIYAQLAARSVIVVDEDDKLVLGTAGQQELRLFTATLKQWLIEQLTDWETRPESHEISRPWTGSSPACSKMRPPDAGSRNRPDPQSPRVAPGPRRAGGRGSPPAPVAATS